MYMSYHRVTGLNTPLCTGGGGYANGHQSDLLPCGTFHTWTISQSEHIMFAPLFSLPANFPGAMFKHTDHFHMKAVPACHML